MHAAIVSTAAGQSITAGDETLPYWPLHLHPDRYSPTKALAERSVLAANGTPLRNGKGHLRTCALRSAGIYGPVSVHSRIAFVPANTLSCSFDAQSNTG